MTQNGITNIAVVQEKDRRSGRLQLAETLRRHRPEIEDEHRDDFQSQSHYAREHLNAQSVAAK